MRDHQDNRRLPATQASNQISHSNWRTSLRELQVTGLLPKGRVATSSPDLNSLQGLPALRDGHLHVDKTTSVRQPVCTSSSSQEIHRTLLSPATQCRISPSSRLIPKTTRCQQIKDLNSNSASRTLQNHRLRHQSRTMHYRRCKGVASWSAGHPGDFRHTRYKSIWAHRSTALGLYHPHRIHPSRIEVAMRASP